MPHRVVWFDIPARNLDRAIAFYQAVLGCKVSKEVAGMEMAVIEHGLQDVSGCIVVHDGYKPSDQGPLLYLNVSGRLEEALAAAEEKGGKVIWAIHEIGQYGRRAIVLDSEGNRVALHSP